MNNSLKNINISLKNIRPESSNSKLLEEEADTNPFKQFYTWLNEALDSNLPQPNAMTLATVNEEGKPSARIVLLKDFDEKGFVFFTNYESNKAKQIENNPWVSLVFLWKKLERQIRIEGKVKKIAEEESDVYFISRPRGSQLGAHISPQSQVIDNREILELQLKEIENKFENKIIPRPENWGGFLVIPSKIEFWQSRRNRLHDRLLYTLSEDQTWLRQRLAP
jgi:pyridoxamine 5'-phosphate oxidase